MRVRLKATGGGKDALVRAAIELLGGRAAGAVRSREDPLVVVANVPIEQAQAAARIALVRATLDDRVDIDVTTAMIEGTPFPGAFPTESVEHTADEGFRVQARDRADVLAAAAEALGALMVGPESVKAAEVQLIAAHAVDGAWGDDERMFAWLSEVLFVMDARRFAIRRAVVLDDGVDAVRGLLLGEALDESRHDVHGAIKAMTYHALEVGPLADGSWRAQVIVDV